MNSQLNSKRLPTQALRSDVLPRAISTEALLATITPLFQQRKFSDVEVYCKALLKSVPAHVMPLLYLGISYCERGAFDDAVDALKQAARIDRDSIDVHIQLSRAYKGRQQYQQALRSMERVVELRPALPDALNECGIICIALEEPTKALDCYQRALALNPTYAEALYNAGNALVKLNRQQEALSYYNRALEVRPRLVDALHNRGNVFRTLQHYQSALADYQATLNINSHHLAAQLGCAKMLELLHRPDSALVCYQRAIQLAPDSPEAWYGAGAMMQRFGRYAEAGKAYEQTLQLKDDFPGANSMLAFVKMCCCDWRTPARSTLIRQEGKASSAALTLPWLMLSVTDDETEHLSCASRWAATYFPVTSEPLWSGEKYRHQKIRVAYLSADFHAHATSFLMAGVFEQHDRSQFEIFAISFGPNLEDAMRARLRSAFDQFIDVGMRSDLEIARMLREMEVDIAIDLKGYTTDSRSGILAHRPAPIQVSYLGYPGTMGTKSIDYILADRVVIAEDQQHHYSEQVIYLPNCYQPNDDRRAIASGGLTRSQASLPERGFVFCCFNNNFKLSSELFDVWMRLLLAVEGSVLWLLEDNALAASNLRKEAERRGVTGNRLVFAPRCAPDLHMQRHCCADLFLDTLPYNAHTTASDALWAGLPIVTCKGRSFAGRVCASLLHAAEMPELITESLAAYEMLALELAGNPERLEQLRSRLVARRDAVALFDTRRFTRGLESAFVEMHARLG
jgi:protein O-GlcNAc transferase